MKRLLYIGVLLFFLPLTSLAQDTPGLSPFLELSSEMDPAGNLHRCKVQLLKLWDYQKDQQHENVTLIFYEEPEDPILFPPIRIEVDGATYELANPQRVGELGRELMVAQLSISILNKIAHAQDDPKLSIGGHTFYLEAEERDYIRTFVDQVEAVRPLIHNKHATAKLLKRQ
jgi:hypothetical protein